MDILSYAIGKASAVGGGRENPADFDIGEEVQAQIDARLTYGTADLTAGTSGLADGVFYFVYE